MIIIIIKNNNNNKTFQITLLYKKHFNDIILLEFVICQCSNNT